MSSSDRTKMVSVDLSTADIFFLFGKKALERVNGSIQSIANSSISIAGEAEAAIKTMAHAQK